MSGQPGRTRASTKSARGKGAGDRPASPGTSPAFMRVVDAFAKERGVTFMEGKGFGSHALKVNGRIFAMLSSRGQYVLKLPADRVKALVSDGFGEPFDAGKGKPMKEWLAISGREDVWLRLGKEAYQFVSGSLSGGGS